MTALPTLPTLAAFLILVATVALVVAGLASAYLIRFGFDRPTLDPPTRRASAETALDVDAMRLESGEVWFSADSVAQALDRVAADLERSGSVPLAVDQFRMVAYAFRKCALQGPEPA